MTTINVNGADLETPAERLSFFEVIRLAFGDAYDSRDRFVVAFSRAGNGEASGGLIAGESIRLRDGMIFDVITRR